MPDTGVLKPELKEYQPGDPLRPGQDIIYADGKMWVKGVPIEKESPKMPVYETPKMPVYESPVDTTPQPAPPRGTQEGYQTDQSRQIIQDFADKYYGGDVNKAKQQAKDFLDNPRVREQAYKELSAKDLSNLRAVATAYRGPAGQLTPEQQYERMKQTTKPQYVDIDIIEAVEGKPGYYVSNVIGRDNLTTSVSGMLPDGTKIQVEVSSIYKHQLESMSESERLVELIRIGAYPDGTQLITDLEGFNREFGMDLTEPYAIPLLSFDVMSKIFSKDHIQVGLNVKEGEPQYITRVQADQIKDSNPELYNILVFDGIDAYNKARGVALQKQVELADTFKRYELDTGYDFAQLGLSSAEIRELQESIQPHYDIRRILDDVNEGVISINDVEDYFGKEAVATINNLNEITEQVQRVSQGIINEKAFTENLKLSDPDDLSVEDIRVLIVAGVDPKLIVSAGHDLRSVNMAIAEINAEYNAWKQAEDKLSGYGTRTLESEYPSGGAPFELYETAPLSLSIPQMAQYIRDTGDYKALEDYGVKQETIDAIKDYHTLIQNSINDINERLSAKVKASGPFEPFFEPAPAGKDLTDIGNVLRRLDLVSAGTDFSELFKSRADSKIPEIWENLTDEQREQVALEWTQYASKDSIFAGVNERLQGLISRGGWKAEIFTAPVMPITSVIAKKITLPEMREILMSEYGVEREALGDYIKGDNTFDVDRLKKDTYNNKPLQDDLLEKTGFDSIENLVDRLEYYNRNINISTEEWATAGAIAALDALMVGGGSALASVGRWGKYAMGGVMGGSAVIFAPGAIRAIRSPDVTMPEKVIAGVVPILLLAGGAMSIRGGGVRQPATIKEAKAPTRTMSPEMKYALDKIDTALKDYSTAGRTGKVISDISNVPDNVINSLNDALENINKLADEIMSGRLSNRIKQALRNNVPKIRNNIPQAIDAIIDGLNEKLEYINVVADGILSGRYKLQALYEVRMAYINAKMQLQNIRNLIGEKTGRAYDRLIDTVNDRLEHINIVADGIMSGRYKAELVGDILNAGRTAKRNAVQLTNHAIDIVNDAVEPINQLADAVMSGRVSRAIMDRYKQTAYNIRQSVISNYDKAVDSINDNLEIINKMADTVMSGRAYQSVSVEMKHLIYKMQLEIIKLKQQIRSNAGMVARGWDKAVDVLNDRLEIINTAFDELVTSKRTNQLVDNWVDKALNKLNPKALTDINGRIKYLGEILTGMKNTIANDITIAKLENQIREPIIELRKQVAKGEISGREAEYKLNSLLDTVKNRELRDRINTYRDYQIQQDYASSRRAFTFSRNITDFEINIESRIRDILFGGRAELARYERLIELSDAISKSDIKLLESTLDKLRASINKLPKELQEQARRQLEAVKAEMERQINEQSRKPKDLQDYIDQTEKGISHDENTIKIAENLRNRTRDSKRKNTLDEYIEELKRSVERKRERVRIAVKEKTEFPMQEVIWVEEQGKWLPDVVKQKETLPSEIGLRVPSKQPARRYSVFPGITGKEDVQYSPEHKEIVDVLTRVRPLTLEELEEAFATTMKPMVLPDIYPKQMPEPETQTETKVQLEPAPSPYEEVKTEPKPEPKPEPIPVPPEPIEPPVEPETETKSTMLGEYIPETDADRPDAIRVPEGTVVWIQGRPHDNAMYNVWKPPYRPEDKIVTTSIPIGYRDEGWSGEGSARQSVQVIGGDLSKRATVDIGIAIVHINPGDKPGSVVIDYERDDADAYGGGNVMERPVVKNVDVSGVKHTYRTKEYIETGRNALQDTLDLSGGLPESETTERPYQGKTYSATVKANTAIELENVIAQMRKDAEAQGMETFIVSEIKKIPGGGYEATVVAHNFNPFKWVKENIETVKDKITGIFAGKGTANEKYEKAQMVVKTEQTQAEEAREDYRKEKKEADEATENIEKEKLDAERARQEMQQQEAEAREAQRMLDEYREKVAESEPEEGGFEGDIRHEKETEREPTAKEELAELAESRYKQETEKQEIEESISQSNLNRLLPVWDRIQSRKDQKTDLTLKEYQEITGRSYPAHPIKDKFGRIYVSWDDAIDNVASEYGYDTPEELYQGLEQLAGSRERIQEIDEDYEYTKSRIAEIKQEMQPKIPQAVFAGGKGEEHGSWFEEPTSRVPTPDRPIEQDTGRSGEPSEMAREIPSVQRTPIELSDVSQLIKGTQAGAEVDINALKQMAESNPAMLEDNPELAQLLAEETIKEDREDKKQQERIARTTMSTGKTETKISKRLSRIFRLIDEGTPLYSQDYYYLMGLSVSDIPETYQIKYAEAKLKAKRLKQDKDKQKKQGKMPLKDFLSSIGELDVAEPPKREALIGSPILDEGLSTYEIDREWLRKIDRKTGNKNWWESSPIELNRNGNINGNKRKKIKLSAYQLERLKDDIERQPNRYMGRPEYRAMVSSPYDPPKLGRSMKISALTAQDIRNRELGEYAYYYRHRLGPTSI